MTTTSSSSGPKLRNWANKHVSQEELRALAAAHGRFITRRPQGLRLQLASARLSGLDLSDMLLSDADFSGADLSGCQIVGAKLERTSFFAAILCHCNLQSAVLKGADLRGASLRGANLAYTVLDGADLRSAFMFRMGKEGEFARNTPNVDNANGGVDFSNCSMKGTSLNEVNLKGANFRNALLERVTFKRAKVADANLEGAVLTQVDMKDLPFSPEALKQCVLDPSPEVVARSGDLLEKLKIHETWVTSGGRQGTPADLSREDLRPIAKSLANRKLTAIVIRDAIAIDVDFSTCELQGANFEGADLRATNFGGADLRGVNFRGTKLAHAKFTGADLRPLELGRGVARAVNLADADYTSSQLDGTVLAEQAAAPAEGSEHAEPPAANG